MSSAVWYCTQGENVWLQFLFSSNFFQLLLHVDPAALPPDLGGSLDYDHTRYSRIINITIWNINFWTEKTCFCTYSIKIEEMGHLAKYGHQLFISPGGWRGASKSQMEKWVTFHYFLSVKFFGKFVVILGVFKLNWWKFSVFVWRKYNFARKRKSWQGIKSDNIPSFLKTWQQTSNNKFFKTNFLFKTFILKTANIAKMILMKVKQMLSHNSYKQTKHPNNTQNSGLNVFSFIYLWQDYLGFICVFLNLRLSFSSPVPLWVRIIRY